MIYIRIIFSPGLMEGTRSSKCLKDNGFATIIDMRLRGGDNYQVLGTVLEGASGYSDLIGHNIHVVHNLSCIYKRAFMPWQTFPLIRSLGIPLLRAARDIR
jgi:hypothetical protein